MKCILGQFSSHVYYMTHLFVAICVCVCIYIFVCVDYEMAWSIPRSSSCLRWEGFVVMLTGFLAIVKSYHSVFSRTEWFSLMAILWMVYEVSFDSCILLTFSPIFFPYFHYIVYPSEEVLLWVVFVCFSLFTDIVHTSEEVPSRILFIQNQQLHLLPSSWPRDEAVLTQR